MIKIKREFLVCILSVWSLVSWANDIQPTDTLTVEIYYQQGISQIDSTYQDNRNRMGKLLEFLYTLSADSTCRLNGLHIISGASPEGNTSFNKALSKKRTNAISDYLSLRLPAEQSALITKAHTGIDWEALQAKVERSDMPYKEEVLQILYHTPEWVIKNGIVVDGRKKQLMTLRQGNCWRYMEEHFFPELRHSLVEVEYVCETPQEEIKDEGDTEIGMIECTTPPSYATEKDSTTVLEFEPQARPPFYMAVKTNLLYDALLVPNIGVEFYVGKGFSVGGNWMYAWWNRNSRHRYWRIYGGELAVRKYFNLSLIHI